MKHFLYLLGVPGAGTSTLMNAALTGLWATEVNDPFYHTVYFAHETHQTGTQLGKPWGKFKGVNALRGTDGPFILSELAKVGRKTTPIVAEGYKLATKDFFHGIRAAGWTLDVVYLDTPDDVAEDRRRAMDVLGPYPLSSATIARRSSDIRALYTEFGDPRWCLDGTARLADLTAVLRTHPVIRTMWGFEPYNTETERERRLMARGIPRPVAHG